MFTHPMKQGTFTKSSGFGPRWGSTHRGTDFAAPTGTPIYAMADGIVVQGSDRAQGSVDGFGSWIWMGPNPGKWTRGFNHEGVSPFEWTRRIDQAAGATVTAVARCSKALGDK